MFDLNTAEILGLVLFLCIYILVAAMYGHKVYNRLEDINSCYNETRVFSRLNHRYLIDNSVTISWMCAVFFPFSFAFFLGCDVGELIYELIILVKNEENRFAPWFV